MKKVIQTNISSYPIEVPSSCPICHAYGDTEIIKCFENHALNRVEVIFRCAFPDCNSYYIGYYPPFSSPNRWKCQFLTPRKPEISVFKESVSKISPRFIDIYKQAEEARALGLDDIAGPGFRKAFEFLIKDYAKTLAPEKKEEIEKSFSGGVLNQYIPVGKIQAVAKRALWLGNDETHYLKKWEKHDVDDLIVLIRLTSDWIDIEHLSETYTSEMPEGK